MMRKLIKEAIDRAKMDKLKKLLQTFKAQVVKPYCDLTVHVDAVNYTTTSTGQVARIILYCSFEGWHRSPDLRRTKNERMDAKDYVAFVVKKYHKGDKYHRRNLESMVYFDINTKLYSILRVFNIEDVVINIFPIELKGSVLYT